MSWAANGRQVALEAVEIRGGRTSRRGAPAWLRQGTLYSLLERLAVRDVRTQGAPPFDWVLNSGYLFRAGGAPPGSDRETRAITSEDPIPSLCVEPATVAAGLQWIRAAIHDEDLLDRRAAWVGLSLSGEFDESRFVDEFVDDLGLWLEVCERAAAIAGKVTIRIDDLS